MNKVKTLIIFIICAGVLAFTFYFYNPLKLEVRNDKMYLLTELSDIYSLTMYSENTAKIDLAGLSNIILNMQADGYEMQNFKSDDKMMDITLQNSDTVFRFYYTKEKDLTVLSSPYNKNGVPYIYIIERE